MLCEILMLVIFFYLRYLLESFSEVGDESELTDLPDDFNKNSRHDQLDDEVSENQCHEKKIDEGKKSESRSQRREEMNSETKADEEKKSSPNCQHHEGQRTADACQNQLDETKTEEGKKSEHWDLDQEVQRCSRPPVSFPAVDTNIHPDLQLQLQSLGGRLAAVSEDCYSKPDNQSRKDYKLHRPAYEPEYHGEHFYYYRENFIIIEDEIEFLTFVKDMGQDGPGHLYLFRDNRVSTMVVKKEIPFGHVTEDQFKSEYAILTSLQGKRSVLDLYGSDDSNESHLNYLEYFPGCNVDTFFRRHGVTEFLLKTIFYQIINGIQDFHEFYYIHRDINPWTILVNEDYKIKLIQYSYSSKDGPGGPGFCTGFVGSIGYAAPEVLAHKYKKKPPCYGISCDMYSIGAVMYRTIFGQVPGYSSFDVLDKTIEVEELNNFLASEIPVVENDVVFPHNLNPLLEDLLRGLLNPNPMERLNARSALKHPYFASFGSDIWVTQAALEYEKPTTTAATETVGQDLSKMEQRLPVMKGIIPSHSTLVTFGSTEETTETTSVLCQDTPKTVSISTVVPPENMPTTSQNGFKNAEQSNHSAVVTEVIGADTSETEVVSCAESRVSQPEKKKGIWRRLRGRFCLSKKSKQTEVSGNSSIGNETSTNTSPNTLADRKRSTFKRLLCCVC